MPKTIRTKDGIVIRDVPDNVDPNGPEMRARVAEARAQRDGTEAPQQPQRDMGLMSSERANDSSALEIVQQKNNEEDGLMGAVRDLDEILMRVPGVPALSEFGAGMARGTAGIIDFFGPDTVNEILKIGGSDKRVPTARAGMQSVGLAPERGAFADGMTADIMGAAGEVVPASVGIGSALRAGASRLPQIGQQSESIIRGMIRAIGQTPGAQPAAQGGRLLNAMNSPTAGMIGQDVGMAVSSAAGAELGEEVGGKPGAVIGGLAGMLGAVGATVGLRKLLTTPQGATQLRQTLTGLSDEGAAKLLAEQMTRESLSPDEVARILDNLGPEAMPADASMQFRSLLRAAADEIPTVQGQVNSSVYARQGRQMDRIKSVLDDIPGLPGLDVDDELKRLSAESKPIIDALYSQARSAGYQMPDDIPKMFGMSRGGDGAWQRLPSGPGVSPTLQKAWSKTLDRINMQVAQGDNVGDFDFLDQLKRTIGDGINTSIRQGKTDGARRLLLVKNKLIRDVDDLIPEYGQARVKHAQQAELQNAADMGLEFYKLKPKEILEFTENMSEAELRVFKAGARRAIINKADSIRTTADARSALFGKNGDVPKMKVLFDTPEDYAKFEKAMNREVEFLVTKNAVTGGARTNLSMRGTASAQEALTAATEATSGPLGMARIVTRVIDNMSKASTQEARTRALREAGEFLVNQGLEPQQVAAVLRQGNAENVRRALMEVSTGRYTGPVVRGVMAERTGRERN